MIFEFLDVHDMLHICECHLWPNSVVTHYPNFWHNGTTWNQKSANFDRDLLIFNECFGTARIESNVVKVDSNVIKMPTRIVNGEIINDSDDDSKKASASSSRKLMENSKSVFSKTHTNKHDYGPNSHRSTTICTFFSSIFVLNKTCRISRRGERFLLEHLFCCLYVCENFGSWWFKIEFRKNYVSNGFGTQNLFNNYERMFASCCHWCQRSQ